jgi:putative membrane protein
MINYNPKDWFTFIFRFHKADTFRRLLPLLAGICLYAGAIAWLEKRFGWMSNTHLGNVTVTHSLLGFVISMLLVFRTNTAYDRWWEGRRLWGSLVNNSRNLAMKLSAMLPEEAAEHRHFFRVLIPAYAYTLKLHLRQKRTKIDLYDALEELRTLQYDKHLPNQLSLLMVKRVNGLYQQGMLSGEQLIVLNAELQSFTDICGGCERIRNTPIPYSYNIFIKKFIFFYVMTLPFGYAPSLGYFVIPVVAFVFYVLASLELIAEEIEEPFGTDENDLPAEAIAQGIQRHVEEIL